jgi:osmotically-inducible protein OsmY
MKFILGFILGAFVGAYGLRFFEDRTAVPPVTSNPSISDTARDSAAGVGDAISEKLVQWHLTGDDIRSDLAQTGQVVRAKAEVVGATMSDARIVAVIKAKYVLDHNLSARDIVVEARDGRVSLQGSVPSANLVGRAIALALDTDGVLNVTSRIVVSPPPP